MRLLIVGSGGREHALVWKASQSPHIDDIYVAPGNAGTASEPRVTNVDIAADDVNKLLRFAQRESIDLTIIGPEKPLSMGIVDRFTQAGLFCIGPTKAAAELEYSKIFGKTLMRQAGVLTPNFCVFLSEKEALSHLSDKSFPQVIKLNGLASGKGVVVAWSFEEAKQAISAFFAEPQQVPDEERRVLIEEYITGREASFMVIADGLDAVPLATSQDHKTRDNGQQGPNTGGMGALSPSPLITKAMEAHIMKRIIHPTLRAMNEMGRPYSGFLYAGLMIAENGLPYVLEFNCRLGDPETQAILLRLKSDLIEACLAIIHHTLGEITLEWKPEPSIGVVLAAKGYPEQYPQGELITGIPSHLELEPNAKVFHAGTKRIEAGLLTAGGRVLCATALGETFQAAQSSAYALAERIHWPHQHYRTDIGDSAIAAKE